MAAVACALVSATVAAAFAPSPLLGRSAVVRTTPTASPLRALRQPPALLSVPPPARSTMIVATASAAAQPAPSFGRTFLRAALACVAATFALLISSARLALAAERTVRRAAPAAGIAISGDVVKYGFVGGCVLVSMLFKREETPILRETPGAATLDVDTLTAPEPPPPAPDAGLDAAPDAAPAESLDFGDSSLFSSLQARMQSLADEPSDADANADDADVAPPPADSTDSWGTGSTAVLEPPSEDEGKSGVLDGESSIQFPPGFPLVDGEVVEVDQTSSASADQIAMLNRMMGKAE
jgi:hypothetical protein